jgi:Pin2-interacting protein X1
MSSREQKISDDPNNKHWVNDTSAFGFKMMQKMGWSKGEGLGKNSDGSIKNLAILRKEDNQGVGSRGNESNVSAKIVSFENVLKKLQPINVKEKKKKEKKKDKKRVEKFKKKIDSKLSKRTAEDYNQIMGITLNEE